MTNENNCSWTMLKKIRSTKTFALKKRKILPFTADKLRQSMGNLLVRAFAKEQIPSQLVVAQKIAAL